jgi:hypothetical protein
MSPHQIHESGRVETDHVAPGCSSFLGLGRPNSYGRRSERSGIRIHADGPDDGSDLSNAISTGSPVGVRLLRRLHIAALLSQGLEIAE